MSVEMNARRIDFVQQVNVDNYARYIILIYSKNLVRQYWSAPRLHENLVPQTRVTPHTRSIADCVSQCRIQHSQKEF